MKKDEARASAWVQRAFALFLWVMAYDEQLAERVRKILSQQPNYSEKKMFGGLCFLLGGNMCCGIVGPDLMLRVAKENYERFLVQPHARPMDFTGRPMKGMLYVGASGLTAAPSLRKWVKRASDFAGSLPPKASASAKKAGKSPARRSTQGRELVQATPAKRVAPQPTSPGDFSGFPKKLLTFLRALSKNNDKPWFDAHRSDYEQHYLAPAQAFVLALGPRLEKLRPVSYEARVNGSIFRINRDTRFSKDKRPYKDHLDLWFWEGSKKGWGTPGFFFRLTSKQIVLGAGLHGFDKNQLAAYRRAVVDDALGKKLQALARRLDKAGFELSPPSRKKVPKGFDPEHPRAEWLLRDGLTASITLPLPAELGSATLLPFCVSHYRKLAPVSAWLESAL